MYKAKFITGYGQREIPMDVAVIGSTDLEVGQLVTFTPANGDVPGYIAAAAGATVEAVLSAATHIIAQSDNTLEYGHIPVENMNYAYSSKVKATASSATSNAPTKKVALFQVTKDDVIVYQE
jgi:allophanate hydrolase subunit 2